MTKLPKPVLTCFLASLVCFTLHFLWIQVVDPFPAADGFDRYLLPIDRYLSNSLESPGNILENIQKSRDNDMPNGFILLSIPIELLGLQEVVLKTPYLLTLVPLLALLWALSRICSHHLRRSSRIINVFLIIFCFPPLQLCLRTFSPHGFVVLFVLSAIIFWYLSMNGSKPLQDLVTSGLFWILAISTKHLGLFLWVIFVFVWLLWQLIKYPSFKRNHFYATIPISIGGMSLYDFSDLNRYIFSLAPESKSSGFFDVALVGLILLVSILILTLIEKSRKTLTTKSVKRVLSLTLVTGLTYFLLLIIDHKFEVQEGVRRAHLEIIIFALCAFALIRKFHWPASRFSFLILLIFAQFVGLSLLFQSSFGQNHWVFVLPLCLLTLMSSLVCRSGLAALVFSVIFAILSNMTPDEWTLLNSGYIPESQVEYLRDFGDMEHFAYRQDQFLSWEQNELKKTRQIMMDLVLKKYQGKTLDSIQGIYVRIDYPLTDRLKFHSNTSERMPSMTEVKEHRIISLLNSIGGQREALFNLMLRLEEFEFILNLKEEYLYSHGEVEQVREWTFLSGDKLKKTIFEDYFKWLEDTGKLQKYYDGVNILKGRGGFYMRNSEIAN